MILDTLTGMELEAAVKLFIRSEKLKFRYVIIVGNRDSNAYNIFIAMNNGNSPYQDHQVKRIECINYVQKRIGTRLRELRDEVNIHVTKSGSLEKVFKCLHKKPYHRT